MTCRSSQSQRGRAPMAINRTLDFYTQMGPADVILAGYFEVKAERVKESND
ncbi:unnamed protein product [marine sediment metagenome]|uniref:Uncharacterized protein n=1 Tax=marine sediment metagenome TaxID=412755 RepID=X0YCV1_9ZZZZ